MFEEDLTVFFDDFGIDIPFKRETTPLFTSKLILDSPSSDIAVYDRSFYDKEFYEARVQGQNVHLLGIAAEVGSLEPNDIATVNGVEWFVVLTEPDGTGLIGIRLSTDRV